MSVWGIQQPISATGASSTTTNTSSTTTLSSTISNTKGTTVVPTDLYDIYENVKPIHQVEIEGVALLQIIKHCHDGLPSRVTGSLLGLDNDEGILEVTNSFPSPPGGEKKSIQYTADLYQLEMMKNLRDVGVDNNKIGWYQSVSMGTFCTPSWIEYQYQYHQSLGPNAVCLIYDTAETATGVIALKAYRLKKSFCDTYKTGIFTKESLAKEDIRSSTILEEVPIAIHNADMIHGWVQDLVSKHNIIPTNSFEKLDLATNSYLENSLRNISVYADELAQEHYKFQGYERALTKHRASYQLWQARQREENKIRRENGMTTFVPEEDPDYFKSLNQPSRLDALLITKQMNTYCERINRYAGKSFQKLFLAAQLQNMKEDKI